MTTKKDIEIQIQPIGIIHSDYTEMKGTPIQSVFSEDKEGWIEIYPEYQEGLKDLEAFQRIWLIYWLDKAPRLPLVVKPYLDKTPHGVFAVRSPCRPNPIGLSSVLLISCSGSRLVFKGVDILEGTPLLDIKPYVTRFDAFPDVNCGWFDQVEIKPTSADDRFDKGKSNC